MARFAVLDREVREAVLDVHASYLLRVHRVREVHCVRVEVLELVDRVGVRVDAARLHLEVRTTDVVTWHVLHSVTLPP